MLAWKHGHAPACPHAQAMFKGHGRLERRMLLAVAADARALRWPGAAQVFLLRRERSVGGKPVAEE